MQQGTGQGPITILVEGETDRVVVNNLVSAMAGQVSNRVRVVKCDGKHAVKMELRRFPPSESVIALIDSDEPSVADSISWAKQFLETKEDNVFCAVPTIEAWLFADKELALKHIRQTNYAISAVKRIVTPESLVNPKHLVNQVFDRSVIDANFEFMAEVNIGRAVASSASLFNFLRGVAGSLHLQWPFVEGRLIGSMDRLVFANLLREVSGGTISWRTLDGEYTAERLADSVLQGNELGLRYVSDMLRLARDILAARVPRGDSTDD